MKTIMLILLTALLLPGMAVNAADNALVISHKDKNLQWGPCPEFIPAGCEIAVLQGDPARKNADIFFKVPADFHIPHHIHTSEERIVLVSGTLDVKYDNQQKVTVNTGEFAYGPAKQPHSAYCHKGEACVLYIGFVAPVDATPVAAAATK
jgi:quercetin dioxygenase-like cupin family protein